MHRGGNVEIEKLLHVDYECFRFDHMEINKELLQSKTKKGLEENEVQIFGNPFSPMMTPRTKPKLEIFFWDAHKNELLHNSSMIETFYFEDEFDNALIGNKLSIGFSPQFCEDITVRHPSNLSPIKGLTYLSKVEEFSVYDIGQFIQDNGNILQLDFYGIEWFFGSNMSFQRFAQHIVIIHFLTFVARWLLGVMHLIFVPLFHTSPCFSQPVNGFP